MLKRMIVTLFAGLLFISHAFAAEQFQEGIDYRIITQPSADKTPNKKGLVEVIEFFSFTCPACYRLNPIVDEWAEKNAKNMDFMKVPVLFRANWEPMARAYYVAKAYGVEPQISQALFSGVQRENKSFTNAESLVPLFEKAGISKDDFMKAYEFSSEVDIQLQRGRNLLKEYAVFEVPTFVVNGQYMTNPAMVGGDRNKLFAVLEHLIEKSK